MSSFKILFQKTVGNIISTVINAIRNCTTSENVFKKDHFLYVVSTMLPYYSNRITVAYLIIILLLITKK